MIRSPFFEWGFMKVLMVAFGFTLSLTASAYQPKCTKILDQEMELSLIGGHFGESNSCTIKTSKGSSVRIEPVKSCAGRLGGRGYAFPGWPSFTATRINYHSGPGIEAMVTTFTEASPDPKASRAEKPENPQITWFLNDDCSIGKIKIGNHDLDRSDCDKRLKSEGKDRETLALKAACSHMIKNYGNFWTVKPNAERLQMVKLPAEK